MPAVIRGEEQRGAAGACQKSRIRSVNKHTGGAVCAGRAVELFNVFGRWGRDRMKDKPLYNRGRTALHCDKNALMPRKTKTEAHRNIRFNVNYNAAFGLVCFFVFLFSFIIFFAH